MLTACQENIDLLMWRVDEYSDYASWFDPPETNI